MKKVEEFDWDWTRRKIIVILPYYGDRLRQMLYSISSIKTKLKDNDWGFLIGDDGCNQDLSSIEELDNARVIKVRNDNAQERNGCLCRNVLIKRCQSEWIISTDPEIHWSGDFFSDICAHPKNVIRAKNTRNISCHTIDKILSREIDIDSVNYEVFKNSSPRDPINGDSLQIYDSTFRNMTNWGIHYGLALQTVAWHALRGYNENMLHYGPDDSDMMHRILKMIPKSPSRLDNGMLSKDKQLWIDAKETYGLIDGFHFSDNVFATHLFHERLTGRYERYQKERNLPGFIRNRDIEWGMQYDK